MNGNIYNSIILSNEQVDYLMQGTAGINRLSCLFKLIQIVTRQIEANNKVGEKATTLWELNMSEVAISKLWKCDRKTVSKMLDNMKKLGILSSVQTKRGSVHTMLCISAWIVGGKKYVNPHYIPINMRGTFDNAAASNSTTTLPNGKTDTANTNNDATNMAEIPNKEEPPIGKVGIPPLSTNVSFHSSLSIEEEINQEMKREVYVPRTSDRALEEVQLQNLNEQMEAENASQHTSLG